jgi:hypothetical protein
MKCEQCKYCIIYDLCNHPDNVIWLFDPDKESGRGWTNKHYRWYLNFFERCKKGEYSDKYKKYLEWRDINVGN